MTSDISMRRKLSSGDTIADGKYLLFDKLGTGGMGAVWRAQQTGNAGFTKPVALKIMTADSDQRDARVLFLNEARISARLHHPNIIEIYDLGQDDDMDYIAMEYIAGLDLDGLLQRAKTSGGLPWELAVYIMIEACKGLHYAHQRKDEDGTPLDLIHRDIKPGNILVSLEGYVKLIDFGIAKSAINDGKTKTGMIKGTPAYMAPEQLTGEPLDWRADLFSLGAVCYELCCGRPAFVGESLYNIIFSIQGQPPQPFTAEQEHLPDELKSLILHCLEKDREDRIQSARALRFALEELLASHGKRVDHESLAAYLSDEDHQTPGEKKGYLPTVARSQVASASALRETGDGLSSSAMRGAIHTAANDSQPAMEAPGIAAQEELSTTEDFPEEDDVFEDEDGTYIDPTPFRHTLDTIEPDVSGQATQMVDLKAHRRPALPTIPGPPRRRSALPWLLLAAVGVFGLAVAVGMWAAHQARTPSVTSKAAPKAAPDAAAKAPDKRLPAPSKAAVMDIRPLPMPRRSTAVRRPSQAPTAKRRATRRIARASRNVPKKRKARAHLRGHARAMIAADITPRCQLFLGLKELGQADGSQHAVPPGRHTLRCVNVARRFVRTFSLRLRPGQVWRYRRQFRRGTLFVLSFPSSVLFLRARGQRLGLLGQSHEKIRLYEGTYQLILRKKGNPAHKKSIPVTISPGKLTRPKVIW